MLGIKERNNAKGITRIKFSYIGNKVISADANFCLNRFVSRCNLVKGLTLGFKTIDQTI